MQTVNLKVNRPYAGLRRIVAQINKSPFQIVLYLFAAWAVWAAIFDFLFKAYTVSPDGRYYHFFSHFEYWAFGIGTCTFFYVLSKRYKNAITEKTKQIARQEQLFRALVENGTDIISMTDARGKTSYLAGNMANLMGYTANEVAEMHPLQFMHPDDVEIAKSGTEWLLANPGKVRTTEYRLKKKDGTYNWIEVRSVNYLDRAPINAIVANTQNIQQRKETMEAISYNELLFRSTFEQVPVGIAHIGLHGEWLRINQTMADITGFKIEELSSDSFWCKVLPEYREDEDALMYKLLRGEMKIFDAEKRFLRKDGNMIWLKLFQRLVKDDNGKPTHFIMVISDITTRKEAEIEAETSSSELSTLIYRSSHDLRGPLMSIQGLAMLLKDELPGYEHAAYFEKIIYLTERLDAILATLRSVSRMDANNMANHTDIKVLIENTAQSMKINV